MYGAIKMSVDQNKSIVFMARTPNGHEYKVFSDGTVDGFESGIRVFNYWLPVYQSEQALRKKATKQSSITDQ